MEPRQHTFANGNDRNSTVNNGLYNGICIDCPIPSCIDCPLLERRREYAHKRKHESENKRV